MNRPNIILEIGQSHGGSMERAKRAIRDVAGLDGRYGHRINFYAKLQLFNPYELFKGASSASPFPEGEASLTEAQLKYLIDYGAERRVPVFASCFDRSSLSAYWRCIGGRDAQFVMLKVASRSHDTAIWKEIGETATEAGISWIDSIVVSAGDVSSKRNSGKTAKELSKRIRDETGIGVSRVIVLYCVPEYPHVFSPEELRDLESGILEERYGGLSDHSRHDDDTAMLTCLSAGGKWYERHFTDNRGLTAIDGECSAELSDMTRAIDTYIATAPEE